MPMLAWACLPPFRDMLTLAHTCYWRNAENLPRTSASDVFGSGSTPEPHSQFSTTPMSPELREESPSSARQSGATCRRQVVVGRKHWIHPARPSAGTGSVYRLAGFQRRVLLMFGAPPSGGKTGSIRVNAGLRTRATKSATHTRRAELTR